MGEYIKHSAFREEVKIGVYRGKEDVECYVPVWALHQFLKSGYESRDVIYSFLTDAKKGIVKFPDYKKFDSSPLLSLTWSEIEVSKEVDLIDELIGEGYVLMISEKDQLLFITTEYGLSFVQKTIEQFGGVTLTEAYYRTPVSPDWNSLKPNMVGTLYIDSDVRSNFYECPREGWCVKNGDHCQYYMGLLHPISDPRGCCWLKEEHKRTESLRSAEVASHE